MAAAAPINLAALLPSWELHLRAERKSPQTVKSYGDGVRRFLGWTAAAGRPAALDRTSINAFVAALLDAGAEPSTARARQLALRRFSAWLVEEGETTPTRCSGSRRPSWTPRSSSRSPRGRSLRWSPPARAGRSATAGTRRWSG